MPSDGNTGAGTASSAGGAPRRAIVRLERTIEGALRAAGCASGGLLLLALSGGPDSVAALHGLLALRRRIPGLRLAAAHFNHRIRGVEADRDEGFVHAMCERHDVDLIVGQAAGLRAESPNLEERARQHRYRFLDDTAARIGARYIVLGHHADDQAETVLMRILRGSGVEGLAGMSPMGPGRLFRPLLGLRRSEIFAYLAAIDAEYVTDSSNLVVGPARNRLRLALLPELERNYAPGVGRRLTELAAQMRELNGYITGEAVRMLEARLLARRGSHDANSWQFDIRGFGALDPSLAKATMRELLRRSLGELRRIGRVHVEAMAALARGDDPSGQVTLPGGWLCRREYQMLILQRSSDSRLREFSSLELGPGDNEISGLGLVFALRVVDRHDPIFAAGRWVTAERMETWFDAAAASVLKVRGFRPGDRIKPLGMSGSRKLHDVFVDRKVARNKRRLWPIVTGGDEILWIPGLLRSRLALVTPKSEKVMHLRVKSRLGNGKVSLIEI